MLTEVDPGSFLVQRLDHGQMSMPNSPFFVFCVLFSHPVIQTLRNLSVNHVMVAGRHLQKGQQTTTQVTWELFFCFLWICGFNLDRFVGCRFQCEISKVKTTIDFLAIPPGAPPSAVPQCFLRLELVARHNKR